MRILHIRNNLLEDFTGSKKHIIDLSASTIPSSYLLPELLAGFGKICPDVYFHSLQSDSAEAIQKVIDGSVDLGLVGQYIEKDDCCYIPFCQDSLLIAAPVTPHYLKLKEKNATLEELIREPMIVREKGSGTKKEMDFFLEKSGIAPSDLNVIARMNDLESIKQSIVNGLGISILSARSVQDLAGTKQILIFPLGDTESRRNFYIVYSRNRILKPHVRQFIQFTQSFYGAT